MLPHWKSLPARRVRCSGGWVRRAPSTQDLHAACRRSLSVGRRLRREVTRKLKTRGGGRAPGGTRPTTNDSGP